MFAVGLMSAARADAQDVERLALVIGNSAYEESGWALAAPANDAARVAEALEAAGFDVELLTDADGAAMDAALRAFAERLDEADPRPAAVFYFAGQAATSRGEAFLFPVDLSTEGEEIHADALHLNDVIARFRRAGEGKGFIVIDACAAPLEVAPEPASACAPLELPRGRNALVAFAAAADERTPPTGESGIYAQALADALAVPALEGDELFALVGRKVVEASGGTQHPWVVGGEGGEAFYFVAPTPADFEARVAESMRWDFARRDDTPESYRGYMTAHPEGRFVGQALARIESKAPPPGPDLVADAALVSGLVQSVDATSPGAATVAEAAPAAPPPAQATSAPAKFRGLDPEDLLLMETTKGRLLIELLPELAPEPVARLRELARERFFDGAPFSRVVDGLFAEAALRPLAPSAPSAQQRDLLARAEPPATPVVIADRDRGRVGVYADGDIAFGMYKGVALAARNDDPGNEWIALCPGILTAGADAAGASFVIMLGEAPALDSDAEAWGRVIDGLDVLYDLAVGDALSSSFSPDRMTRVRVVSDLSDREAGEIYASAGAVLDETGPGFAEFTASLSETLGREPRLCEIRLPIVGGAAPGLLPPTP